MQRASLLLAAGSSLRFGRRLRQTSNGSRTAFVAADADCFLNLVEEDFPVTDLARSCAFEDRLNRRVHDFVLDYYLEFHLRQEIHTVFTATVGFLVALLAAVTSDFRNCHPFHTNVDQSLLHRLKPVGLYDCFEFRHLRSLGVILASLSVETWSEAEHSASGPAI